MHSVALGKAFQTMCFELSFVTGQNPSILTKSKNSLTFFPEWHLNGSLAANFESLYNFCLLLGLFNFKTKMIVYSVQ